MTDDTTARLDRLRMARSRLEAQLADGRTPAYSVAPLANQLRLTDKEVDRLTRVDDSDDGGLPTTPDRAGFIDFLHYARRTRRSVASRRTNRGNEWTRRRDDLMASWAAAGFVLPDPTYRERHDDLTPAEYRSETDRWVERCRAELTRCLATPSTQTHQQGEPQ